jgi:hypothetical protein
LPKSRGEPTLHPTKQSSKQTEARPSLQRLNLQSVVERPGASPDQVYKSYRCAITAGGKQGGKKESAVRKQLSNATSKRICQLPEMRGSKRLCRTGRDQSSWLRCGNRASSTRLRLLGERNASPRTVSRAHYASCGSASSCASRAVWAMRPAL